MLTDVDPATNLAVKDLERAKKFYEGTLGWKLVDQEINQIEVDLRGVDAVHGSHQAGQTLGGL
jgi:catechol 2,3-dioxygenase-like lactoylglutathione lyase family enzyme